MYAYIKIFFKFIVTKAREKLNYKSSPYLESGNTNTKGILNLIYVCGLMCSYWNTTWRVYFSLWGRLAWIITLHILDFWANTYEIRSSMLYHASEVGPVAFDFKRIVFLQKTKTFLPWKFEVPVSLKQCYLY